MRMNPVELQGYEVDIAAMKRFEWRYGIPAVIAALCLLVGFVGFCGLLDLGKESRILSLVAFAVGLAATAVAVGSYYGPIRCSKCGCKMKKFQDRTLDREREYGHVFVCDECGRYFKRKVTVAA